MDIKQMKELIKAVSESDVTTFEFEDEKEKIKIKKDTVKQEIIAAPAPHIMEPQIMAPIQPSVILAPQTGAAEAGGVSAVSTASAAQENKEENCNVVKSPLVGTFYSSASPEAEPFVKVGDHVSKGQVLGIIEAMKLMNDIESDYDGEIIEIMVNNKDMVEYEQPLFKIK